MAVLLFRLLEAMRKVVSLRGPGSDVNSNGRDLCGTHYVEPLLEHLPQFRLLPLQVKREGSLLLLDLVTQSPANQMLMAEHPQQLTVLWGNYLPSCGDFTTQVNTQAVTRAL
ncbi:MAG: hypothetical protein WDW36_005507 [Sanguina aurantia]